MTTLTTIRINGVDTPVPAGAIGWKYADPTEGARWIYDEADLRAIRREDPSLVVEAVDAIPGCAMQVYAGWVWMIGSDELSWTKRSTREACEAEVLEFVRRRGVDALTD